MVLTRKRKLFLLWWHRREGLASKGRLWIHPIRKDRKTLGEFKLLPYIFDDDEKCFEYFRTLPTTFQSLLNLCASMFQKRNTKWRKSISPNERLVVTPRALFLLTQVQSAVHRPFFSGVCNQRVWGRQSFFSIPTYQKMHGMLDVILIVR
ncbi:hypothetical protein PoB_004771800 [Plakobranchus ocellatus]|uniref:Uncharacterized protein n=1 Tax=Plakobranchus ocellatus TaxID=259542 RepID=A0AAV4BQ16_9GAST|nr:hypothetical protein PoB_004771800 [Plakobranchus ocellatus]